jgi:hypothetical protein
METFPFTFRWDDFPAKFRLGFKLFRTPVLGKLIVMVLNVFVNNIIPASIYRKVFPEVLDNYKKMFPSIRPRYPVYVWPNELPLEGSENETLGIIKELQSYLPELAFPMLLVISEPGGIIRKEKVDWLKNTLMDLTVVNIGHGIHFIQEDNPVGIAKGIIEWSRRKKIF